MTFGSNTPRHKYDDPTKLPKTPDLNLKPSSRPEPVKQTPMSAFMDKFKRQKISHIVQLNSDQNVPAKQESKVFTADNLQRTFVRTKTPPVIIEGAGGFKPTLNSKFSGKKVIKLDSSAYERSRHSHTVTKTTEIIDLCGDDDDSTTVFQVKRPRPLETAKTYKFGAKPFPVKKDDAFKAAMASLDAINPITTIVSHSAKNEELIGKKQDDTKNETARLNNTGSKPIKVIKKQFPSPGIKGTADIPYSRMAPAELGKQTDTPTSLRLNVNRESKDQTLLDEGEFVSSPDSDELIRIAPSARLGSTLQCVDFNPTPSKFKNNSKKKLTNDVPGSATPSPRKFNKIEAALDTIQPEGSKFEKKKSIDIKRKHAIPLENCSKVSPSGNLYRRNENESSETVTEDEVDISKGHEPEKVFDQRFNALHSAKTVAIDVKAATSDPKQVEEGESSIDSLTRPATNVSQSFVSGKCDNETGNESSLDSLTKDNSTFDPIKPASRLLDEVHLTLNSPPIIKEELISKEEIDLKWKKRAGTGDGPLEENHTPEPSHMSKIIDSDVSDDELIMLSRSSRSKRSSRVESAASSVIADTKAELNKLDKLLKSAFKFKTKASFQPQEPEVPVTEENKMINMEKVDESVVEKVVTFVVNVKFKGNHKYDGHGSDLFRDFSGKPSAFLRAVAANSLDSACIHVVDVSLIGHCIYLKIPCSQVIRMIKSLDFKMKHSFICGLLESAGMNVSAFRENWAITNYIQDKLIVPLETENLEPKKGNFVPKNEIISEDLVYVIDILAACEFDNAIDPIEHTHIVTAMILLLTHVDNGKVLMQVTKILSKLVLMEQMNPDWWAEHFDKFEPIVEYPAFIAAVELLLVGNVKSLAISIINQQLGIKEWNLATLKCMLQTSPLFSISTTSYGKTLYHLKLLRLALQSMDLHQDKKSARQIMEFLRTFHGKIFDKMGHFYERTVVKDELLRLYTVIELILKP